MMMERTRNESQQQQETKERETAYVPPLSLPAAPTTSLPVAPRSAPLPGVPVETNPLLNRIKAAQERARLQQQRQRELDELARQKTQEETKARLEQDKPREVPVVSTLAVEDEEMLQELEDQETPYLQPQVQSVEEKPESTGEAKPTLVSAEQKPAVQQADNHILLTQEDLSLLKPKAQPSAPPSEYELYLAQAYSLSSSHHGGELPQPIPVPMQETHDPAYEALLRQQREYYEDLVRQKQEADKLEQEKKMEESIVFEYDEMGNKLSPEQRAAMEEEQRKILEQIQQEAAANARAIREAMGASGLQQQVTLANGVIVEANITPPKEVTPALAPTPALTPTPALAMVLTRPPTQIINVGGGQKVAIHDQTKTREAIQRGTALLVECVSCQNWMQISESATLMFCPCCQSVVPIVPQNTVKTREEAIQMQRDRKLAQDLQKEEEDAQQQRQQQTQPQEQVKYASFSDYVSSLFFGTATQTTTSTATASPTPTTTSTASLYPGERRATIEPRSQSQALHSTDLELQEEERLLPARVADPPAHAFSCFERSVSSVLGKLTGKTPTNDDYEQVEFDDDLLAMTDRERLSRPNDATTEYTRLLDDEDYDQQHSHHQQHVAHIY